MAKELYNWGGGVVCQVGREAEKTIDHRAYPCNGTQRRWQHSDGWNKRLVYAPEMIVGDHDDKL